MFPKINPIQTQSWALLNDIFAQKDFDLRALFNENPNRFKDFSIENENFLFDFYLLKIQLNYNLLLLILDFYQIFLEIFFLLFAF